MPDLIAYKLDGGNFCDSVPGGDNPFPWYGVYFVNQSSYQEGVCKQAESTGSVTLMNSNFSLITQRRHNERGYLLLINSSFLPMGINPKFEKLRHLMKHGCGPFRLNAEQTIQLKDLFDKIIAELSSSYKSKNDLLAILLAQLVHFMIKNFALSRAFV